MGQWHIIECSALVQTLMDAHCFPPQNCPGPSLLLSDNRITVWLRHPFEPQPTTSHLREAGALGGSPLQQFACCLRESLLINVRLAVVFFIFMPLLGMFIFNIIN